MSPITVGILGLTLSTLLTFLGMPIGFSFFLIAFLGMFYLEGFGVAMSALVSIPYMQTTNFILVAVPLFLLMGVFATQSGISRGLYDMFYKWFGRFPGGLAMATIATATGFAAASGSGMATAAAIGSVALPEMKRLGYSDSLATGAVAAGGTIGIMIPPSVPLVIYGMMTDESVGSLFAAGILPGLMEALSYFIVTYIVAKIYPKAAPSGPFFSMRERLIALRSIAGILVLFLIVMGSIYLGIATPTEAAAIGATGSFIFVLIKGKFSLKLLYATVIRTATIACMLMTIFMGTMVFSAFLATTGVPYLISDWLVNLPFPPIWIVAIILLMYLPLGCIMESMAMILLTVPIFIPVLETFDFSLVWFGIVAIRAMEISEITPPIGVNVFVLKGVAKDVPMEVIFKGILIFLVADLVCLPLLLFFPQISLFLPNLMMK